MVLFLCDLLNSSNIRTEGQINSGSDPDRKHAARGAQQLTCVKKLPVRPVPVCFAAACGASYVASDADAVPCLLASTADSFRLLGLLYSDFSSLSLSGWLLAAW